MKGGSEGGWQPQRPNPIPQPDFQFPVEPPSWKRRALLSLIFYTVDAAVAITCWHYAFGLTVKNWPVLVVGLIFGRWVLHTLLVASVRASVREGGEA